MPAADLAAFRADPIWPLRAAAAPTILRELDAAEHDPAAGLDALAAVRVPVLQLVGSRSPGAFRVGAACPRPAARRRPPRGDRGRTARGAPQPRRRVRRARRGLPARLKRRRRATIRTMTNPAPAAPADDRPYSPGLEGVVAGETASVMHRRRLGAGSCTAATDRRARDARAPTPRSPKLLWTGEWDPAATAPGRPVPGRRADRRCAPCPRRQADGRAADRGVGVGRDGDLDWPPTAEQARALTAVLAVRAGGVRPAPRGQGADRAGPRRSTSSRASCTSSTARGPTRDGPGARRLLHRRRGARLQRLDVHRARDHLDPVGHRLGGRRRDRRDEGAAPRRRAVGGRRADPPGRLAGAGGAVGERHARPRRAADGLRPSRVSRLRPARGGAAQGRRVDGAPARLAGARDRGRRRRAAGPRREAPGAAAQDQRRVLRGARC